jgi:hypothetical protein
MLDVDTLRMHAYDVYIQVLMRTKQHRIARTTLRQVLLETEQ